ncbi:urease accessory protein UreF [Chitinimonas naiadis]
MQTVALLQLLRLASPALPVGAYSYSQGLEWAIESGTVKDATGAERWISDLLQLNLAHYEVPLLSALMAAWQTRADAEAWRLNREYLASRESAELRAETLQMGYSMQQLLARLPDLSPVAREQAAALASPCWPSLYALAASDWGIPPEQALTAYLWSWLENQVMVLMKALPLGQVAGQTLLSRLMPQAGEVACRAGLLPEAHWHNLAPGFALASCHHESQYSRLFRS